MCAAHAGHTHAVYFIAEIVLKSTAVARFKLHHGLTVACSEIGNKNIPLSVGRKAEKNPQPFHHFIWTVTKEQNRLKM